MQARRLLFTLFAAGPIFYMGLIAVTARAAFHDWRAPEYGHAYNPVFVEYGKLLAETRPLVRSTMYFHAKDIETAGRAWVDAWKCGKITDIPPAAYIDSGQDGAKAEIEQTRDTILTGLARATREERRAGETQQSLATLQLVADMMEVGRYDNLLTSIHASTVGRILVEDLQRDMPAMSLPDRKAVLEVMSKIEGDPDKAVRIFARQAALLSGTAWAELPSQGGNMRGSIRSVSFSDPKLETLAKNYRRDIIAADLARAAYASESGLRAALKKFRAEFGYQ